MRLQEFCCFIIDGNKQSSSFLGECQKFLQDLLDLLRHSPIVASAAKIKFPSLSIQLSAEIELARAEQQRQTVELDHLLKLSQRKNVIFLCFLNLKSPSTSLNFLLTQ